MKTRQDIFGYDGGCLTSPSRAKQIGKLFHLFYASLVNDIRKVFSFAFCFEVVPMASLSNFICCGSLSIQEEKYINGGGKTLAV